MRRTPHTGPERERYWKMLPGRCVGILLLFFCGLLQASPSDNFDPQKNPSPIESIVHARELDLGKPIKTKGVVTYAFGRCADFVIQDHTGGIYVETRSPLPEHFPPGVLVEVEGTVSRGDFAPKILLNQARVLGIQPLWRPRQISYEDLVAGKGYNQQIQIEGVVRTARVETDPIHGKNVVLVVVAARGKFTVRCPDVSDTSIQTWVDSKVQITGVARGIVNREHQLITPVIYCARLADIRGEIAPPPNPFGIPELPIRSLLEFSHRGDANHRIKVVGTVLYCGPGQVLFVRDETGAVQVFPSQPAAVKPGDLVEVLGFPVPRERSPALEGAVIHRINEGPRPRSLFTDATAVLGGRLDCDLITVRGVLIDYLEDSGKQGLWLQSDGILFDVYWVPRPGSTPLDIRKQSELEVTGVALPEISGLSRTPQTFHLLMASPDQVRVLRQPSWWSPWRVVWAMVLVVATILAAMSWATFVSKKNKLLAREIIRRQGMEQELQRTQDELQQRFEGRTAELHDQITRREQAEAEFQAVLRERIRIAQELHDTLEQGLIGIAMQLETASELLTARPEQTRRHLELARRFLSDTQVETKRSVRDLRSLNLEQGDLLSALRTVGSQLWTDGRVTVECAVSGTTYPLPPLTENSLFRIGQEALTNAMKHGDPGRVSVLLEYGLARVTLRIRDNGCGFQPELKLEGYHFGLQGMKERVKRVGGTFDLDTAPGQGTQVLVSVPILETEKILPMALPAAMET